MASFANRRPRWPAWSAVEIPPFTDGPTRSSSIAAQIRRSKSGVRIRNASDLPVSSVWVALVDRYQVIGDPFRVGLLPPAADPVHERVPDEVLVAARALREVHGSDWEPDVAIAFIDSSGHGWVRDPRGALCQVDRSVWDSPDLARAFGQVGLLWAPETLPDH
jgi:hypothetical protein